MCKGCIAVARFSYTWAEHLFEDTPDHVQALLYALQDGKALAMRAASEIVVVRIAILVAVKRDWIFLQDDRGNRGGVDA